MKLGGRAAKGTLIAFLLSLPTCASSVQAELFWGLGTLANYLLAKSQERTYSAVMVGVNIYVDQNRDDFPDERELLGTWFPDVSLGVGFDANIDPREVIMEFSAVNNGPDPKEPKVWLHDGGRQKRLLKPNQGRSRPFLGVTDLYPGVNWVKVEMRRGEYKTFPVQRLDFRQTMDLLSDEGVLGKISRAGQAMFPGVSVFWHRLPSGEIRYYNSKQKRDEMVKNPEGWESRGDNNKSTPTLPQPSPNPPRAALKPNNAAPIEPPKPKPAVELPKAEVKATYYDRAAADALPMAERTKRLHDETRKGNVLDPSDVEPISIPDGQALSLLIRSRDKFSVMMIDPKTGEIRQKSSREPAFWNGWYEQRISIYYEPNTTQNDLLITDQAGRKRVIKFERKEVR